ncbi:MAG: hypothetical protein PVI90_00960 [Desulfobacteraceae bacterium]|jgi:hypothetical protein
MTFYKQGIDQALQDVGLKPTTSDTQGSPFPEKSPNINAERLALVLQQQNDEPDRIFPENKQHSQFGKPVSWGQSIDLSGMNQGQPVAAGIMLPSNPRS